jgi:hypothetical protein
MTLTEILKEIAPMSQAKTDAKIIIYERKK